MLDYLLQFLLIPYVFGGQHPANGFDCSGLICEGLKAFNYIRYDEDLSAQGIYDRLVVGYKHFSPDVSTIAKGDLLFFGKSPTAINHVAIAKDNFQMLEAGGGDSKSTNINESIKQGGFVRLRPIKMRRDLVATIRL